MFSDLVGSTALSARMDPEDLREVISAYQKCVADTVQRFGGFLAKYMGDGVLIYFGYPQAHEDDAERAVRAGLELIEAVSALKSAAPLQTRVGIATGLVVVGDLIGSGEAQDAASPGRRRTLQRGCRVWPSRTRWLWPKARASCLAISLTGGPLAHGAEGHRRTGARLRGVADECGGEPVRGAAHSDDTARRTRRGDGAAHAALGAGQSGRGPDRARLRRAGIGKSRLAQTMVEWLAGEPHIRLRFFCSPHHQDSALFPVIAHLERAAGFRRDDRPEQRLAKLEVLWPRRPTISAQLRRCSPTCSRSLPAIDTRRSTLRRRSARRRRWLR